MRDEFYSFVESYVNAYALDYIERYFEKHAPEKYSAFVKQGIVEVRANGKRIYYLQRGYHHLAKLYMAAVFARQRLGRERWQLDI